MLTYNLSGHGSREASPVAQRETTMDSPPTGTVTFLFTDIEGSSRLWETYPDAMAGALALPRRHPALGRPRPQRLHRQDARRRHPRRLRPRRRCPRSAVPHSWPSTDRWPRSLTLKVRCALHTATAEERDGDYFGPQSTAPPAWSPPPWRPDPARPPPRKSVCARLPARRRHPARPGPAPPQGPAPRRSASSRSSRPACRPVSTPRSPLDAPARPAQPD